MIEDLKSIIWSQFSAAIETMEQAIHACPDEIWSDGGNPEWKERDIVGFWYLAWHKAF